MRETRTVFCEGPDCEVHQITGRPSPHMPAGWLRVKEWQPGEVSLSQSFCGWDCLLRRAAEIPPAEIIEAENLDL